MRRRDFLVSGAALGASAMIGGASVQAQEQQVFKLGHVLAPTHQFQLGMELAAKEMAAASNGRLKLEIYPSSQLGTERDMHVGIRTGAVDMLLASPAGASVHLKDLGVLDAPYLFRDEAQWRAVVYGAIGQEWDRKIDQVAKARVVGWFHRGIRHVISRGKGYPNLADIRGQKIRVADLPLYPAVFKAFGAVPTPIPFAEMYSALEAGIVDGADAPLDSVMSMKLNEVSKFVTLIEWSRAAPGPVMMSDAAWKRIPDADRAAFLAAIRKGTDFIAQAFIDQEESTKAELGKRGMSLVQPVNLGEWRAAVDKALPDIAKTWGGDLELYKRIVDVKA